MIRKALAASVLVTMLAVSAAIALGQPPVFDTKWGSIGAGDGQFNYPRGIAVDAAGNVYVVETSNHRIQKFTGSGGFLATWGSYGSSDGQFAYPNGVAVDAAGNVYVAETGNHRIQKLTGSGGFLATWGSYGSSLGQFDTPIDVAVDAAGNVYVVDFLNHRIQKFNSSGDSLATWGSYGSSLGQFLGPNGVAVDATGNVYVADSGNERIQKFNSSGGFLATWGSLGSGDGQFGHPTRIAVDAAGNAYVADYVTARIQKFNSSGGFLATWGSLGSGDGQFDSPNGVALDATGNVYVADSGNHRIQKFAPAADPVLPVVSGTPDRSPDANGWYSADVTISWSVDDPDANVPGANLADLEGIHTYTSDQSCNDAGCVTGSLELSIDKTPPSVNVIGVSNGGMYNVGSVPVPGCETADTVSGVDTTATLSVSPEPYDAEGNHTATCSAATDLAGNAAASVSVTYGVVEPYAWTGFQRPISDPPALNELKAGAAVPVKFSLGGDQGLAIFAAGYAKSVPVACNASAPVDAVDETVAAGKSGLSYDATADEYTYVWKTDKKWAGSCRQLIVKLDDGSTHWAIFKFK